MELSRLIEALSAPSAYPQSVETVGVHQTHISVVFLAGPLAYKIKKPVDLGFANYSTLERRRHFCEEEVRLNRRLAPEVYLGVVPVTRDSDAVRIDGRGEAIEWAVKMERLPDSATLRSCLERNDVSIEELEALACRLAQFHAAADRGEEVAAGASYEAIARIARENLEQPAPQVGITLSRATFVKLTAGTDATLAVLQRIFESRAARGIPRDTHGDLRLDHVYRFPERQRPFDWIVVDCIEFDERFRYADPISDIAFLAMEMTLDGRGDLAWSLSEAYIRATGDAEARAILPFYMAYRAAVRGKVEGMKLTEQEIPEPIRAAARSRARALWLFALTQLVDATSRPCLLLVAGLPGTGKSTLASDLEKEVGFAVIRSDLVRKELAGRSGHRLTPAAFGADLYSPDWNDRTYTECLRRAEQLVFEGRRVLVDASFREESRRRTFLDAARGWGIVACLMHCEAAKDVVSDRLDRRRGDASDADWTTYLEAARRWEKPAPLTRAVIRPIDTGGGRRNRSRRPSTCSENSVCWTRAVDMR